MTPVLVLSQISKRFGATQALDHVSLELTPGTVHGLVGQNGCGKSTLIKVLSGYHAPDEGTLSIHGEEFSIPFSAVDMQKQGLAFVHQDLGLITSLTVAENLFLAEVAMSANWHRRLSGDVRRAQSIFDKYGVDIDPRAKLQQLPVSVRAQVAIIRAVEQSRYYHELGWGKRRPGCLVLDEATAALPASGVRELFGLIKMIVQQNDTVLFVSHHIEEVMQLCDRVTVMRDGRVVDERATSEHTEGSLIQAIVGRKVRSVVKTRSHAEGEEPIVRVRGLAGRVANDVNVDLLPGEIVGLAGLDGAGWEDVLPALFGARAAHAGHLQIGSDGYALSTMTPRKAVKCGIAYLSGDRGSEGGVGEISVRDNLLLQVLPQYSSQGRLRLSRMGRDAKELLATYGVKPDRPAARLRELSGGNQQKVIIAKWLRPSPRLVLLQDPTIGVDIGARASILDTIRSAARAGAAVICASSDASELAQLCDRVLVFVRGEISVELHGDEMSEAAITSHSYAGVDAGATEPPLHAGVTGARPHSDEGAR